MADEVKGLDELLNTLEGIATIIDTGINQVLTDTADDIIDSTKRRTNRITGKLQDSWEHGEVQKDGDVYTIELGSDCEYAKFVEDGHRQEVGRYVPAIGKRLKKPFVQGKWMLKDSITQEEDNLQKNIDELFKGVM